LCPFRIATGGVDLCHAEGCSKPLPLLELVNPKNVPGMALRSRRLALRAGHWPGLFIFGKCPPETKTGRLFGPWPPFTS